MTPNLTVNRTRRHMLSFSQASARRAGYLARWASRCCIACGPDPDLRDGFPSSIRPAWL